MTEKREIICIGCPIGCMLEVSMEYNEVEVVKGYSCIKGKNYALKECTNPTRIVTSSVKVINGELNVVSVKTESDIPKDKIADCIRELRGLEVEAPVKSGDIIIKGVAGTTCNIIATKSIEKVL
ncbi:MAG: hypothetical protein K0R21_1401 [Anaerocolumna sp.]|nr:hypothetical protein [Anaerocolumna sp.]